MQEERTSELSELIEYFHRMWDKFPGACSLIHKTKEVIAVNPPGKAMGREVGMICAKHGPPELHQGCLAGKALADSQAQQIKMERNGRTIAVYWIPIEGYEDYYLHFSLDIGPSA